MSEIQEETGDQGLQASPPPDFEPEFEEPAEPARLAEELRIAAEQILDEQKLKAAHAARGIAQVLRQAAAQVDETPAAPIARYAIQTATNVERLSDRVRDEPLTALLADAEAAARSQPELFFLGAAAAGFMIGRFFKASADRRRAETAAYQAARADRDQTATFDRVPL